MVEPLDPRDVPVRLEHVSFAYPGRQGDVLRDLSLVLASGERVALVGPSGAGKSTIARLLLRFDRPDDGRLLVGAIDLDAVDGDAWRRHLAWVPQRPHLSGATIGEAIRLGAPGAAISEVADAARRAGAEAFIAAMPDGYATPLGEGDIGLSADRSAVWRWPARCCVTRRSSSSTSPRRISTPRAPRSSPTRSSGSRARPRCS